MGKAENFVITLTPHRSLSRAGFITIMAIVVGLNLAGSIAFLMIGAWPVLGFMGLDVALVWWAFRRNYADAATGERILVEGDKVVLSRLGMPNATETSFNRRWLRVELEYDADREIHGRLFLRSHGVVHEIASFLGADERQSLAKALRQSL